MTVRWTAQALERLVEIETFIAARDPAAAARVVERLVTRGEALARLPDRGRRVPELPSGQLRELVHGHYRIVYRIRARVVEILTVFEGHRLLRRKDVAGG